MNEQIFVSRILDAVNSAVNEVAEPILENAKKEFERTLRERIGAVAISLAQFSEIQWNRDNLIITVKFEKP